MSIIQWQHHGYTNKNTQSTLTNNVLAISIQAQDMEENKVQKQEKLQISKNEGTQIKTDKVKYEVNDDINIKLN